MGKHKSRAKRAAEMADELTKAAQEVREAKTIEDANEIVNSLLLDDKDNLQEEMEAWRDGMQGTNLESTGKYGEVEECCDQLDSIDLSFEEAASKDDVGELADRLEEAAAELEAVEFPGMF